MCLQRLVVLLHQHCEWHRHQCEITFFPLFALQFLPFCGQKEEKVQLPIGVAPCVAASVGRKEKVSEILLFSQSLHLKYSISCPKFRFALLSRLAQRLWFSPEPHAVFINFGLRSRGGQLPIEAGHSHRNARCQSPEHWWNLCPSLVPRPLRASAAPTYELCDRHLLLFSHPPLRRLSQGLR